MLEKKSYSILCVDDNKNMLTMLTLWLTRAGYKSYTAHTADEALSLINSQNIDMALIDYRMPETNGFTLIKKIRKDHSFPVIVVSAEKEEMNQVVGLRSGADDYISKPVKEALMLAKIEALFRRSYIFSSKTLIPLKDGTIRFNSEKNEISDGINRVILSHNESVILRKLSQTIGQPVSPKDLCELLGYSTEKSLITTVSRLKSKLIDNGINNSFIENIRGLGYVVF
ncbi:MAG: response regulator transcription factor [Lachnospiraceae bacterium]|nr:response regulator transcription factor [Lachnospiraceae bacterium]